MPVGQMFSSVALDPPPPALPVRILFRRAAGGRAESRPVRLVRERIESDFEALRTVYVNDPVASVELLKDLHGIAHSLTRTIEDQDHEKNLCTLANSQLSTLEQTIYRLAQKRIQHYFRRLCSLTLPAAGLAVLAGALLRLFGPGLQARLAPLLGDEDGARLLKLAGSLALVLAGALSGAWFKEALYFKFLSARDFDNDLILNIDGGPLTLTQRLGTTLVFSLIVILLLYGGAVQIRILGIDVGDYQSDERYWIAYALGFVLAIAELRFMKHISQVFSKNGNISTGHES